MKTVIVFITITLSPLFSFSQDYFEKIFPFGNKNLHASKLISSKEKGYYLLCYSIGGGEYGQQLHFVNKIDSSGNILWSNEFVTGDDYIGLLPADFSFSPDSSIYLSCNEVGCLDDGTIIKIDRLGNILWDRKFDLNIYASGVWFSSICSASNNDQIIGGSISGNNCNSQGPYICRMSPNGATIWEQRWDSIYPGQSINKIEAYHDSTYLLHLNSITVQINNSGQIISTMFPIGSFIVLDDGGFLSVGQHQLIRLSDSLLITWLSPMYTDRIIYGCIADSLGNYFITGRRDTCNGEMFISKLDSTGNILFTRLYGGNLNDEGRCIIIDNNDQ